VRPGTSFETALSVVVAGEYVARLSLCTIGDMTTGDVSSDEIACAGSAPLGCSFGTDPTGVADGTLGSLSSSRDTEPGTSDGLLYHR